MEYPSCISSPVDVRLDADDVRESEEPHAAAEGSPKDDDPALCSMGYQISDGFSSHSEAADTPLASSNGGSTGCKLVFTESSIMRDVMRAMGHDHTMPPMTPDAFSFAKQPSIRRRKSRPCARTVFRRFGLLILLPLAIIASFVVAHVPVGLLVADLCNEAKPLLLHAQDLRIQVDSELATVPPKLIQSMQSLIDELEHFSETAQERCDERTATGFFALAGGASMAGCCSVCACWFVMRQLGHLNSLGRLMARLGELDLAQESEESQQLLSGSRSCVQEICELQDAFCRLCHGIERFARFVPQSVVCRMIRGELRAARLHVDRREVTIMFSDIADFTTITEQLCDRNPRDLLFVLTRYFTVMTQIVEVYGGAVGELLGDGILAFWNTPLQVVNHQVKACKAALAKQRAVQLLNAEFAQLSFPMLKIRIGINTGTVLTGNIGSITKMKFGCIGDDVNLTSRLENLCKMYGVGILCSEATHASLLPSSGVLCRRLDCVQVKGKTQPTTIYEVLGCEVGTECPDFATASSTGEAVVFSPRSVSVSGKSRLPGLWRRGGVGGTEASIGSMAQGMPPGILSCGTTDSQVEMDASALLNLCVTSVSSNKVHIARIYEEALVAYQSGLFDQAVCLAQEVLEVDPTDIPSTRLLERSRECLKNISPNDLPRWSWVSHLTEK
mmetsp:Transcript_18870/g.54584  ORF Transcript_18870/g.54584 Transcript_18870/m.54584 type:complete len:673 (-) Transcript_18870:121-2139(-)